MATVTIKLKVERDHTISGVAPIEVPEGEHEVLVSLPQRGAPKFFNVDELPVDDTPWDGSICLRREDMYGDDGR